MRTLLIALAILLCQPNLAFAQVGVGISINMPVYPEMVVVPGYPVYYDPMADSNYFFYDGMYWVYANDGWYSSAWYNGPWVVADPNVVPVFLYRVPVRYYRSPPEFFVGWAPEQPPRWGEHFGPGWEGHHSGWDHWDRHAVPPAAPLPSYQRQYFGDRYPHTAEQQRSLVAANYKYRPRESVSQQRLTARGTPASPRAPEHHAAPQAHEAPREAPREMPHEMRPDAAREAPRDTIKPTPGPEHSMMERPPTAQPHESRPAPARPEGREVEHKEERR